MARPNQPTDGLQQIHLSARELTNQQQLQSLLGVAGFMHMALHTSTHDEEGEPIARPAIPESGIAAENCFIKACEAIEKIVTDPARWGTEFQSKVEADYSRAMQLNLEYIQANRDAAAERATPHAAFEKQLKFARMEDGSHVAFIGDPRQPNNGVFGVGRSPQEALDAFDTAFRGVIAESTKAWAEAESAKEQAKESEPPKRKRIYPKPRKQNNADDESNK